ncbi:amidohydrolase [Variovorax paradoxus]|uniref:N-substituted formamide deformylase n=1 Tax=Variovorax paradoxus TaxID=34073 RepID=A0A679IZ31_VARPD|nr:N-substituted formamide deformylase [Variovorax paradoxus]
MQDAELIFENGQVLTMVPGAPPAQAVALAQGRVLATGSNAGVARTRGPGTQVVDLAGRTLVPGLIDAHAHMEREGLKTLRPSLAHARNIADVLAVVAAEAARLPRGAWIVTMPVGQPPFYFGGPSNLAEGRMPDRHELDAVAPDHLVYIPGLFGNWGVPPGHSALNSRALALHRIDDTTCPDCSGLQIELGPDGQPNGVIVETNKRPLVEFSVLTQVPAFGFDDRLEGLRRSLPLYHACGTTSIYEGHGSSPETIAVYRRLWEEGGLTMRTRLCVSPTWSNVTEARLAMRDWLSHARGRGTGDTMLSVSGVYIGLGGDKAAASAVRRALPNTGWMGFVEWANRIEDFSDYAWLAAEHDLRVHSVVVDRLAEVLDVFEAIDARFPLAGRRWVVEHVGHVTAQDIARVKRLGLMVTSIPFYMLWKNGAARLADEARHGSFLPQRDLLEAGLPLAAGSDNIPVSLFTAVWASVARQERTTGRVIGPAQSLDRLQALQTVTRNGAFLSFEEDRKGTLAPGHWADIAVLNADPLGVPVDELAHIRAELTLVGGRVVHGQPPTDRISLPSS